MRRKTKSFFYWQMAFVLFCCLFLAARAALGLGEAAHDWLETVRKGAFETFAVLGELVVVVAMIFNIFVVALPLIFKKSDLPPIPAWTTVALLSPLMIATSPHFQAHVFDPGWDPDLPTLGIAAGAAILVILFVRFLPGRKDLP